jgi:hypothetical protein
MKKDIYPPDKYPNWIIVERAKLRQACAKIEGVVDLIEQIEFPTLPDVAKKELLKAVAILRSIYETN